MKILRASILITIVTFVFLIWVFTWLPISFDGTIPAKKLRHLQHPSVSANQQLTLGSDFVLEVFDAVKESDPMIMVLKNSDGKILWSVAPELYNPKDIKSIRFHTTLYVPFGSKRLKGTIREKNGHSASTMLVLRSDGTLDSLSFDT